MKVYDDEGFYFDRIYLLSRRSSREIMMDLPVDRFKQHCRAFEIVNTDRDKGFHRSRIMVVAPTSGFLSLLLENEMLLGDDYKISYLEIAHDKFCESAGDAELKADILFYTVRKKYSFAYIYVGKLIKTKKERLKDHKRGLFALRTFYSYFEGEDSEKHVRFKYIIYARRSKINDKYCVHKEWRIVSAGLIARKTRIKGINDLVCFDIKQFFGSMEAKYVVHEKIDYHRLGLWLSGTDGRRKLKTRRALMCVDITAQHFVYHNCIETYSDLVLCLKQEKEMILSKPGPKSEYEKRFMALTDYEMFRYRVK